MSFARAAGGISSRIVWRVKPSMLGRGVAEYKQRILAALRDFGELVAARLASYAKEHAPWTDRTGDARKGLTARAIMGATSLTIVLFHTMAYGIWLEVKHGGKWGIILRTMEAHYGRIMAMLRALLA